MLLLKSCFQLLLLRQWYSQGSVPTHLRSGRIFSDSIITNFLPIPIVKKVRKLVNIWWNYISCTKSVKFFRPPCIAFNSCWKRLDSFSVGGETAFLCAVLHFNHCLRGLNIGDMIMPMPKLFTDHVFRLVYNSTYKLLFCKHTQVTTLHCWAVVNLQHGGGIYL